ncbi:MAG: pilus assembly protein [Rhodoferax sp.]
MVKSSNKPFWLAIMVLLGLTALAFKVALAITAFTPASQPVGYVGQDDITNYNLTSGREILFRGQYEKEYWGGNLIAYAVNSAGDVSAATQPWNGGAAYQLELQATDRRIFTLRSDGAKIPFLWASLDATQQGYLTSSAILDFLRGVRTGEVQQGGAFRQRASALGDIVHSRPYYLSDSTSATPAPTVLVGANDGMLHAFNAESGAERWAYVPSMLIPKMKNLSVTPYAHDYYVDGSVNVATILSGAKRIAVGALGAGGKGLYALDITGSRLAPATESAAADNILWEITPSTINNAASSSYANLGYTYANPTIAKLSSVDVVVVGNGYNNGGDYQAYLYLINANTGALISAIRAGTTGTAASPNGLSTPVAVDSNNDGNIDTVYAGDLNGTMWKFDLGTSVATVLLTTSPAQPITMSPGVARHPNGGYMVNFATGAMLAAADMTDSSVFAAYGIWDGAPAANAVLLTQTLTPRCYTSGTSAAATPCASRVRTASVNQPDWTAGASNHKGWRVALPAGEKVVGDGSFVENGRFYFTGYNPTVSSTVQTSTIYGENWLMELDYLTGGAPASNLPFLDLSGNHVLDDDDRVKFATPPTLPTDSIPIGKMIGIGVMSQPVLVQLSTLNNTLFNQNPDVTIPPVDLGTAQGVTGGHFDVDIFYAPPTGGAQASATITVGTTGQTNPFPATLGAITVDGVTIVPALTVSDITNGTASSTNTTTITNRVTGGFTATKSGNVITIKAPMGVEFNGKAITIGAGTSQTLLTAQAAVAEVVGVTAVAAVRPTGFITFAGKSTDEYQINDDLSGSAIRVGGSSAEGANIQIGKDKTAAQAAANVVSDMGTGGTYKGYIGGNSITPLCAAQTSNVVCIIDTSSSSNGSNNGRVITVGSIKKPGGLTFTTTATAGGVTGVTGVTAVPGSPARPQSGWTDFAPALTATAFNNSGVEPGSVGDTCADSTCKYDKHFHQYDDIFDVTGVNMLNPSSSTLDLKNGIPSLKQNFKLLVQNQYLSPAVKLHIGDPSYLYNIDHGYVSVKNYATSATLDLATLQTYRRDPNAVWPGAASTDAARLALPKPIGSLVFNMPLDALTPKNWWGNGDIRVGLHPTIYNCVWQALGSNDGNMYQPVIPPANGVDGRGVAGWSGSTTPTTATGARHNGALVVQIIRDTTPNTAIEQNVSGRPEYGWRVKSGLYSNYVLAEYATYWHHPNGKCYSSSGWTKTPAADNGASTASNKAAGSTDPKLGDLSAGTGGGGDGTITSVVTNIVGSVTTTTITYADGTRATITRTANADGSVTIVTVDALNVRTVQTVANPEGSLRTGGDERARQAARTGRISWRELVAP